MKDKFGYFEGKDKSMWFNKFIFSILWWEIQYKNDKTYMFKQL